MNHRHDDSNNIQSRKRYKGHTSLLRFPFNNFICKFKICSNFICSYLSEEDCDLSLGSTCSQQVGVTKSGYVQLVTVWNL